MQQWLSSLYLQQSFPTPRQRYQAIPYLLRGADQAIGGCCGLSVFPLHQWHTHTALCPACLLVLSPWAHLPPASPPLPSAASSQLHTMPWVETHGHVMGGCLNRRHRGETGGRWVKVSKVSSGAFWEGGSPGRACLDVAPKSGKEEWDRELRSAACQEHGLMRPWASVFLAIKWD